MTRLFLSLALVALGFAFCSDAGAQNFYGHGGYGHYSPHYGRGWSDYSRGVSPYYRGRSQYNNVSPFYGGGGYRGYGGYGGNSSRPQFFINGGGYGSGGIGISGRGFGLYIPFR